MSLSFSNQCRTKVTTLLIIIKEWKSTLFPLFEGVILGVTSFEVNFHFIWGGFLLKRKVDVALLRMGFTLLRLKILPLCSESGVSTLLHLEC